MKRVVSLLLSAALLLGALSACRTGDVEPGLEPSDHTAKELADAAYLASGHEGDADVEYLTTEEGGGDYLSVYLENAYGFQGTWEDAAVIRATGASAFEIAVVRMADEDAAVRAASSFMSYLSNRQGDFVGYAPAEADMVARGGLMQKGPFTGLFICPNPDGAGKAVEAVLNGEDTSGLSGSETAADDVKALRDILVSSQGMDATELEKLDDGDLDALNTYVEDAYGLTPDQWEECAIARGTGDSAFEVAVLRVPGEWDWDIIGAAEEKLNDYLDRGEAAFDSSSEQGRLFHGALVGQAGANYLVLLVCEDREGAIDAFCGAANTGGFAYNPRYQYLDTDPDYSDRCLFTPPNKDDMSLYDTSAILAAWEKGDPSGLSKDDKRIYEEAAMVLKQVVGGDMSDYEKEVAIYDWVVHNVDYDWTHQNILAATPRASFTPYGGLVNHTAVCLGYATTFQLLMDLAGVECITVPGAAFESREDHAWNMVRLNGEWYCVDVTWDANCREQVASYWPAEYWNYFNVTSDEMAEEDHQWDYANTPEATATDHGRG